MDKAPLAATIHWLPLPNEGAGERERRTFGENRDHCSFVASRGSAADPVTVRSGHRGRPDRRTLGPLPAHAQCNGRLKVGGRRAIIRRFGLGRGVAGRWSLGGGVCRRVVAGEVVTNGETVERSAVGTVNCDGEPGVAVGVGDRTV